MAITEVRIRWATAREAMRGTCAHINQLEDELASVRSTKRNLQRELTELEIREKGLMGQIKYYGTSVEARKAKASKVVASSVGEAFSGLSDEAKAELVKEILGGLEL